MAPDGELAPYVTADEMAPLRALMAADPQPTRATLSREFCWRIGWFKPDGGLKDIMAKVTMLAMHRDGLIELPAPTRRHNRPRPIVFGPDTEPPLFPVPTALDKVRPLDFRIVVRGTREGRLWNEFVARYHYLGYKTPVGAQMRYAVHDRNGWPLAMLGFSTAAWKLAPRDSFIGWTDDGLLGVVISHPHQDHYGLARHNRPEVPLWIGRAANDIMTAASAYVPGGHAFSAPHLIADRTPVEIGPFRITPYLVDHSAFDAYALLVEADVKRVFYSGDFRAHGRKKALFEAMVNRPPGNLDVLLIVVRRVGCAPIGAISY